MMGPMMDPRQRGMGMGTGMSPMPGLAEPPMSHGEGLMEPSGVGMGRMRPQQQFPAMPPNATMSGQQLSPQPSGLALFESLFAAPFSDPAQTMYPPIPPAMHVDVSTQATGPAMMLPASTAEFVNPFLAPEERTPYQSRFAEILAYLRGQFCCKG